MKCRSLELIFKRAVVLCSGGGLLAVAVASGTSEEALAQDRVDRVTDSAAEIQGSESFGQPYERDTRQGQGGRQFDNQGYDQYYEEGQRTYGQENQGQRRSQPGEQFQRDAYRNQQFDQQSQQGMRGGQERGGLGVVLRETGGQGVQVIDIYRGSPAEEAGLRPGDQIVEINGQNVRSVRELQSRIAQRDPGSQIEVVALRNGEERSFDARLESRQEALSQQGRSQFRQDQGRWTQGRSQGQDRQVAARLASLERQLQQLLSEVRTLRSQVSDVPPMPRQAQRGQDSFQQQGNQQWDGQGQMDQQYYYDQEQNRPGANQRQRQPQGQDNFDF